MISKEKLINDIKILENAVFRSDIIGFNTMDKKIVKLLQKMRNALALYNIIESLETEIKELEV